MNSSPQHSDDTRTPPDKSTVILLLGTIGDTTWRMFVPTIGLTVAGLFADKQLRTKPWIMIVSMGVGVVLAWLLVRDQIKKVKH